MRTEHMPYPSKKDPELIKTLLERIALGDLLAPLLRDANIHYVSWYSWVREDEELALAYTRARAAGHDQIAITARETARGRGESTGDVQRDKLIVDLDLKLLAKWSPRYGDKLTLTGDADNPIVIEDRGSELATELLGLLRGRRKALQIEGKLAGKPGEGPARITGEVSPKTKAKP